MILIIKDNTKDVTINNHTIFKLLIPIVLNSDNSLFSIILIKKNCVDIIKIKGKMSYNIVGDLNNVNNIG